MGKRSDFERIDKDYYRTIDVNAVIALKPHLPPSFSFCEPCAGDGSLIDMIESYTQGSCYEASDMDPMAADVKQIDALSITETQCEYIITNPPWSRPILHKLIDHLSTLSPTWLLFDAAWAYTEQKTIAKKHGVKTVPELLKRCRKIVAVGRLQWIPDTKMKGKDDCAWYLFDGDDKGPQTEFYGIGE